MNKNGNVRLQGVVKRHGETTVLHGVDLEIRAGEFFVLLGPSGSGKTTTLRILAGLEPVSAGQVRAESTTEGRPDHPKMSLTRSKKGLSPSSASSDARGTPVSAGRCCRRFSSAVRRSRDGFFGTSTDTVT